MGVQGCTAPLFLEKDYNVPPNFEQFMTIAPQEDHHATPMFRFLIMLRTPVFKFLTHPLLKNNLYSAQSKTLGAS